MKIEKVMAIVNGNRRTMWRWPGENHGYGTIAGALRARFSTQGDFYQQLGVSFEDAQLAGWGPDSCAFHPRGSGWAKFLADRGKMRKHVEIEVLDVLDVVLNNSHQD